MAFKCISNETKLNTQNVQRQKFGGEQGALEAARTFRDKALEDQAAWEDALASLLKKRQTHLQASRRLRVFLCHSKDDKDEIRSIYKRLLSLGCEPWLDEESLLPGQDWDAEIRKAIKKSHVFLACLSADSVTKRGYIQKEIKFALDAAAEIPEGEIFIVPVKMEPCTLPPAIEKWHWLEIYKGGYRKLIATLTEQANRLNLDPLRT